MMPRSTLVQENTFDLHQGQKPFHFHEPQQLMSW
jgi:hypothetical protein